MGIVSRRRCITFHFVMVLINAPLPDEFGHDLAVSVTGSTDTGVKLLVKNELAEDVSAKVENFGVFVLPKQINRSLFYQSVKLITDSCKRLNGLRRQTVQLENKIEEMRLIDRAKCTLMQYLSMTEPQAHRYIEKQAMDMRLTKRAIAESILNTYESLNY